MMTRALESREERKDAKRKKEEDGLNAAALEIQCRSIGRNQKIGRMVDATALSTQCRSMRGLVQRQYSQCYIIEQWVSQH